MKATCTHACMHAPGALRELLGPGAQPGLGAPTKAPRWGRAGTSLGGVALGAASLSDWPSAAGEAWPRSRWGVAWPQSRALIGSRPPVGRGLGAADWYKRRLCPRPRRTGHGRQQRRTRFWFFPGRDPPASPRLAPHRSRPAGSSGARLLPAAARAKFAPARAHPGVPREQQPPAPESPRPRPARPACHGRPGPPPAAGARPPAAGHAAAPRRRLQLLPGAPATGVLQCRCR